MLKTIENRAKFLIALNKDMSLENPIIPIGIGGYGVVYKDRYQDRYFAIKISLKEMKNEVDILKRLANLYRQDILKYVNYYTLDEYSAKEYQEYQTCKSKYKNILEYYKAKRSDIYLEKIKELEKATKFYILITEYVEGLSLLDAIILRKKFDIRSVFCNILDAVKACHKIGIFHLDLKPENIILKEDGSIVLVDFGLAQQQEIGEDLSPNCLNVLGTKEYVPKKVRDSPGKNSVGCSSVDVYSLGCILYTMIFKKFFYPPNIENIESISSPSLRKLITDMTNDIEENRITMDQVRESLWLRPVYIYMLPLSTKWWKLQRINKHIPYRNQYASKYETVMKNYLTDTLRDMVADEKSEITFPTLLILDDHVTSIGGKYLYGATFDKLDEIDETIAGEPVNVFFRKYSKGLINKKSCAKKRSKNARKSVNRSRRKHK
jgi:serine/threonine protein kinase